MHVLHHLPFSLIISSLLSLCFTSSQCTLLAQSANIVARAAPVDSPDDAELLQLTPDTFEKSVADGNWLVEHFSPSCPHCRQFAPIWEQLVHEAKVEFPSVNMAQVNCALYGDLCSENEVKGYPSIMLYNSGKLVTEFRASRELSNLKDFLHKNLPLSLPPSNSDLEEEEEIIQTSAPNLNREGRVLSLTPSTFDYTLAKGPAFIKFFAPWCGHCKRLAPTWARLAKETQNGHVTIAEVNCEDHSALCKKQNVEGFPTLLFFGRDGKPTEYKSGRKLDQLVSFIEKAGAPPLQPLKSPQDLQDKLNELNVVYLLLSRSRPSETLLNGLKEVASPLLSQPPIFYSSSPELIDKYNLPAGSWGIIALKDSNMNVPSSIFLSTTLSSDKTNSHLSRITDPKGELSTWLQTHRLQTYLELTRDTFQPVMSAPEEPLVVIAAVPERLKTSAAEKMTKLALMWRVRTGGSGRAKLSEKASGRSGLGKGQKVKAEMNEREVIFTWMDADKWSDWISGMYGLSIKAETVDIEDVGVVIVDHKKLIYYDQDAKGEPLRLYKMIFDSIQDAVDGNLPYKRSENMIERLARFLNNGLVGAQAHILEHPFKFTLYVLGVFVVFIVLLRRFVVAEAHHHGYGRVERLD